MRCSTEGRCLSSPFTLGLEGTVKGHSFKLKEPLQCDVESLFPLGRCQVTGFRRTRLEAPQAEQVLPLPDDNREKGHYSPSEMVWRKWILKQVR